ncbi:MAG: hypothetical protein J6S82_07200 [Bacteroidales bacterium]|nr:hypothetical protein [Bacteroidales bacterium]
MQVLEVQNRDNLTIFGDGDVFILTDHYDGITEREAYILAECYEEGKIFQIIQITGEHSGYMAGYVNYGILKGSVHAVTYEELIEAIKYNFIKPDLDTIIFFEDKLELKDFIIYQNERK